MEENSFGAGRVGKMKGSVSYKSLLNYCKFSNCSCDLWAHISADFTNFIILLAIISHLRIPVNWKKSKMHAQPALQRYNIQITDNAYQHWILTLKDPCISECCIKIKIKLHFCFHTSVWCLRRFYEGSKGLHKIFWGTTKI